MERSRLATLCLPLMLPLFACSNPTQPSQPPPPLTVVGFSPFAPLKKGESVDFTATVDSGESTAGQGTLTVQDQAGNPVPATVSSPIALPRYGQATLRATFVVPQHATMIKVQAIFQFEGDPFPEPYEWAYEVR